MSLNRGKTMKSTKFMHSVSGINPQVNLPKGIVGVLLARFDIGMNLDNPSQSAGVKEQ